MWAGFTEKGLKGPKGPKEPLIKWEGHLLHSKEAAGKAATQEHPSWL